MGVLAGEFGVDKFPVEVEERGVLHLIDDRLVQVGVQRRLRDVASAETGDELVADA